MSEDKHVATYVSKDQRSRWDEQAEEMDMTRSAWVRAMVEAGLKKFSRDAQPDETKNSLRQKITDLRKELQRARDRIEKLEEQLHLSEQKAILNYIQENPGAEYGSILQHLTNTAHSRVTRLLDQMEGDKVEIDDQGRMYKK